MSQNLFDNLFCAKEVNFNIIFMGFSRQGDYFFLLKTTLFPLCNVNVGEISCYDGSSRDGVEDLSRYDVCGSKFIGKPFHINKMP